MPLNPRIIFTSTHWTTKLLDEESSHEPRLSPAQYSITVQNRGLKHHSFHPTRIFFSDRTRESCHTSLCISVSEESVILRGKCTGPKIYGLTLVMAICSFALFLSHPLCCFPFMRLKARTYCFWWSRQRKRWVTWFADNEVFHLSISVSGLPMDICFVNCHFHESGKLLHLYFFCNTYYIQIKNCLQL